MLTEQKTPVVGTDLVNPVTGTRTLFLATAASTDGAYVEVEATYPAHSTKPPLHLHPSQDEHFTVVSGHLHALVDGVERDLRAGDVLEVTKGVSHQMWGGESGPSVVLWRTTPALRTDQMLFDLWQAAADNAFQPDLLRAYSITLEYPEEFCLC
jgi:mannose-6-phosphate isomerase-like protein (cupin superfamily)